MLSFTFCGNVINVQFSPIKLPQVRVLLIVYKSTHIVPHENHRGELFRSDGTNSKILGIGSSPFYGFVVLCLTDTSYSRVK